MCSFSEYHLCIIYTIIDLLSIRYKKGHFLFLYHCAMLSKLYTWHSWHKFSNTFATSRSVPILMEVIHAFAWLGIHWFLISEHAMVRLNWIISRLLMAVLWQILMYVQQIMWTVLRYVPTTVSIGDCTFIWICMDTVDIFRIWCTCTSEIVNT